MTSTTSTSSATKWIGEVPSGWRVLEPRRVFSLRREPERPGDIHLTPSQKYGVLPQEEYVAITGSQVVRNLSGTTMQHVEAGDFISHLRTFQGGLELAKQAGKVSPAYTVVTPGPEAFPNYYKYVLKSRGYISQIASVTDQLRDGQSMRFPEFNETWLPVPPFEEQKLIADYLDRETAEIDALISEQNALLALLAEHRASFLDSSLYALGSSKVPLKYRGSLSTGLTVGAVYNEPVSVHPYIRVANVQAGRLDLATIAEVAVPDRVAETRRLYPGDVLMTEGGDRDKLGRGALWSGEVEGALHQNHVFAFRCGPQLDPQFLVYVLEASDARQYFEATASQSTNLASTNSTLVKRFRIPDVSIQLQHAVVEALNNEIRMIEAASEDAYRLIELAEERRAALISAAVTGQIDVTAQGESAAEQLKDELEVPL